MSMWCLVTHKQMTVLYTTDHYLAGHTEKSEVCVLEHRMGGAKDIVLVGQNYDDRELRGDVKFTRRRQSRKMC